MADYGIYVDNMLILIFGGIPWQVYFQRVLSAKSEKSAMYLSYVAAIGCLLSGIPPAIIGMIGKAAGKTIYNFNVCFRVFWSLDVYKDKRLFL